MNSLKELIHRREGALCRHICLLLMKLQRQPWCDLRGLRCIDSLTGNRYCLKAIYISVTPFELECNRGALSSIMSTYAKYVAGFHYFSNK